MDRCAGPQISYPLKGTPTICEWWNDDCDQMAKHKVIGESDGMGAPEYDLLCDDHLKELRDLEQKAREAGLTCAICKQVKKDCHPTELDGERGSGRYFDICNDCR